MKSVRTAFTLSEAQHQELQKISSSSGVSISWIVRHAVSEFLNHHKDNHFNPLVAQHNSEVNE
ncbi:MULTISPECIES: ribbon-helix-helix domain-containing protein [Vibrio]|uniref:ribbon-helix-helix domain-containing protein n=1 Tax=Vibrio TaxID=662 RepID=UPI00218943E8|nr:ribbon-helix-helix domain-containing protein [Vibrio sp. SCSIO 43186]USD48424.1 ribbon-helix-helix domain-containing protein [Vibrio sp. SCSIO 43145]USD72482.1 ribbon-helix-helix domain-containing protein [Vibrio sp. SCSIO 43139]USD98158.1 hypothetical protein CTT30_19145 [Vibrio coralliilyticus]